MHALQHILFVSFGIAMWMALLGPLPKPAWFGNGAKIGYIVAVRLIQSVLANALLWSSGVLYPRYAAGQAEWGISPANDQSAAGAIMMIEGSIVTIGLFCWLFLKAARESEERQALVELAAQRGVELSEERAARAVAAGRGDALRAADPRRVLDLRQVREVLAAWRAGVLADVADARLGEPQQLERVEPDRVPVVAAGAQHRVAVEQPDVDDLGQRQRPDRRQRADVEVRERLLDLLLAGQPQVARAVEQAAGLVEVEPVVGGQHRDAPALAVVQQSVLAMLRRSACGGRGLVGRRERGRVLDDLVSHARVLEEAGDDADSGLPAMATPGGAQFHSSCPRSAQ